MGDPKKGQFEYSVGRDGKDEILRQYKERFKRELLPFEVLLEFAPVLVRFDVFFSWLKRFGQAIIYMKSVSAYIYVQSAIDSEGNRKFPDKPKYRYSCITSAEPFFQKSDIFDMYSKIFDVPLNITQRDRDYLDDKYSGMRFRQVYRFVEILYSLKRYPDMYPGYVVTVEGWRRSVKENGWNVQVFMRIEKKSGHMSIADKMNFIERIFVGRICDDDIKMLQKDDLKVYLICSDDELDEAQEKSTGDKDFYKTCTVKGKYDEATVDIVVVSESIVPVVDDFKLINNFHKGELLSSRDYEVVKRYFQESYDRWMNNEG
jgi:hypothetical protein